MYDERERFLIRYAHHFAPFTVARASGAWIETNDGRRILDFTSGQICRSTRSSISIPGCFQSQSLRWQNSSQS